MLRSQNSITVFKPEYQISMSIEQNAGRVEMILYKSDKQKYQYYETQFKFKSKTANPSNQIKFYQKILAMLQSDSNYVLDLRSMTIVFLFARIRDNKNQKVGQLVIKLIEKKLKTEQIMSIFMHRQQLLLYQNQNQKNQLTKKLIKKQVKEFQDQGHPQIQVFSIEDEDSSQDVQAPKKRVKRSNSFQKERESKKSQNTNFLNKNQKKPMAKQKEKESDKKKQKFKEKKQPSKQTSQPKKPVKEQKDVKAPVEKQIEKSWLVGPEKSQNFLACGNLIKYNGQEWCHIAMDKPLTKSHPITQFTIRLQKCQLNQIYIGIASFPSLSQTCEHHIQNNIPLLSTRFYKAKNKKYLLACFKEGDTIRVVVDSKGKKIYWFVGGGLVRSEGFESVEGIQMYPCVEMRTRDDVFEWVV